MPITAENIEEQHRLVEESANYGKEGLIIREVLNAQTDDPKNPIVLIADDEKKKKHNLMLEKNISILQIV